ncbi:MAG: hypothetical protein NZ555_17355, partial [Geminicoccaceae bacterium]|nr:hypothetical protein [Geminicoccaceae bacterium]
YEVLAAAPPDRASGFVFIAGQAQAALERFTGDRNAVIVLVAGALSPAANAAPRHYSDPILDEAWLVSQRAHVRQAYEAQADFVADICRRTERSGVPVIRFDRLGRGLPRTALSKLTAQLRRSLGGSGV